MSKAITDGACDFVGIARPLTAEFDLPKTLVSDPSSRAKPNHVLEAIQTAGSYLQLAEVGTFFHIVNHSLTVLLVDWRRTDAAGLVRPGSCEDCPGGNLERHCTCVPLQAQMVCDQGKAGDCHCLRFYSHAHCTIVQHLNSFAVALSHDMMSELSSCIDNFLSMPRITYIEQTCGMAEKLVLMICNNVFSQSISITTSNPGDATPQALSRADSTLNASTQHRTNPQDTPLL